MEVSSTDYVIYKLRTHEPSSHVSRACLPVPLGVGADNSLSIVSMNMLRAAYRRLVQQFG